MIPFQKITHSWYVCYHDYGKTPRQQLQIIPWKLKDKRCIWLKMVINRKLIYFKAHKNHYHPRGPTHRRGNTPKVGRGGVLAPSLLSHYETLSQWSRRHYGVTFSHINFLWVYIYIYIFLYVMTNSLIRFHT